MFACVYVCMCVRDLGLCITSVFAFGEPMRSGNFPKTKCVSTRKNQILPLRCGSPNESTKGMHRPRSRSPLHFDFWNI